MFSSTAVRCKVQSVCTDRAGWRIASDAARGIEEQAAQLGQERLCGPVMAVLRDKDELVLDHPVRAGVACR